MDEKEIAMQTTPTTPHKPNRDYRLDIIKAISITLVLFWHFQPIDITAPKLTDFHISGIFREGIKSFYQQVTLLGVPSFILVSLFLYFSKLQERGYSYSKTRLLHLVNLFIFWVSCQIIIFSLTSFPISMPLQERIQNSISGLSLYNIFIEGGPRLPFVGGSSVFYFFTTLFLLTLLSTFYFLLNSRAPRITSGLGWAIVISSLLFFEYCSLNNVYIELLDLRTFIIYIPIAHFFCVNENKIPKGWFLVFITGYILFSVQDYLLRGQGFIINVYLRAAIVFGALALFHGIKNLPVQKGSRFISFLSIYSLGIYAVHKYFQFLSITLLTPYFEIYDIGKKTHFGKIHVNMQVLTIGILGISLTLLCVYLLGKTPLKKFVRG
jgi:hypothetical protein